MPRQSARARPDRIGADMTPTEFNLKTLRQARGAMRQPSANSARHMSILCMLHDGAYLSVAQMAAALGLPPNSLSGTATLMVDKRLLNRIGDRGDYRYTASEAGRALCD